MNLNQNGWNLTVEGRGEVYVRQVWDGAGAFVARFKYAAPKASANHFVKFLVANITPSDYFGMVEQGMAPLTILKSRGYVSLNEIKARKYAAQYAAQQAAANAAFVA